MPSNEQRFEDELEAAYWRYDKLKTHGDNGDNPQSERDAFKRAVRHLMSVVADDRERSAVYTEQMAYRHVSVAAPLGPVGEVTIYWEDVEGSSQPKRVTPKRKNVRLGDLMSGHIDQEVGPSHRGQIPMQVMLRAIAMAKDNARDKERRDQLLTHTEGEDLLRCVEVAAPQRVNDDFRIKMWEAVNRVAQVPIWCYPDDPGRWVPVRVREQAKQALLSHVAQASSEAPITKQMAERLAVDVDDHFIRDLSETAEQKSAREAPPPVKVTYRDIRVVHPVSADENWALHWVEERSGQASIAYTKMIPSAKMAAGDFESGLKDVPPDVATQVVAALRSLK